MSLPCLPTLCGHLLKAMRPSFKLALEPCPCQHPGVWAGWGAVLWGCTADSVGKGWRDLPRPAEGKGTGKGKRGDRASSGSGTCPAAADS